MEQLNIAFVFPIFIFKPLTSIPAFQFTVFSHNSTSLSANKIKSPARSNSYGNPTCNSLVITSVTITNNKRLYTDPWCSPTFTSKALLSPSHCLCTLIHHHDCAYYPLLHTHLYLFGGLYIQSTGSCVISWHTSWLTRHVESFNRSIDTFQWKLRQWNSLNTMHLVTDQASCKLLFVAVLQPRVSQFHMQSVFNWTSLQSNFRLRFSPKVVNFWECCGSAFLQG